TSTRRGRRRRWNGSARLATWRGRSIWTEFLECGTGSQPVRRAMIESFKQLEEIAADRDLAEVFLESDEQEHAVPRADILEALSKRRAVMRDCVERGKSGGQSMGKLVGDEARKLNAAFQAGTTF